MTQTDHEVSPGPDGPAIQTSRKRPWVILAAVLTVTVVAAVILAPIIRRSSQSARVRSQLDQVESDWKSLLKSFSEYGRFISWGYPPDTMYRRQTDSKWPLTFETDPKMKLSPYADAGFAASGTVGPPQMPLLTTPVAYLNRLPDDPFNRGHYYGYTVWNHMTGPSHPTLAILHSPGPDETEDVHLADLRAKLEPVITGKQQGPHPAPPGSEKMNHLHEVKEIIFPLLYDPTNGVVSGGDLLWVIYAEHTKFGWRANDEP